MIAIILAIAAILVTLYHGFLTARIRRVHKKFIKDRGIGQWRLDEYHGVYYRINLPDPIELPPSIPPQMPWGSIADSVDMTKATVLDFSFYHDGYTQAIKEFKELKQK